MAYILDRVVKIDGKSVAEALVTSYEHGTSSKRYMYNDLKYDLKCGYLELQKKVFPHGVSVSHLAR